MMTTPPAPLIDGSFSFADVRVMRNLLDLRGAFVWDELGTWTRDLGYPSIDLNDKLIEKGWMRNATLVEQLCRAKTVPMLKTLLAQAGLSKSGDKSMLAERLATEAEAVAAASMQGLRIVILTAEGREFIGLQSGYEKQRLAREDRQRRGDAVDRLIQFCRDKPGMMIEVSGHSWSNCERLSTLVGLYRPDQVPPLPPYDCPNVDGACTCWRADIQGFDEVAGAAMVCGPVVDIEDVILVVKPEIIQSASDARPFVSTKALIALMLLGALIAWYGGPELQWWAGGSVALIAMYLMFARM